MTYTIGKRLWAPHRGNAVEWFIIKDGKPFQDWPRSHQTRKAALARIAEIEAEEQLTEARKAELARQAQEQLAERQRAMEARAAQRARALDMQARQLDMFA